MGKGALTMIYINIWNDYHVITPLNKETAHKSYNGFKSIKTAWILLDRLNVKIEDRSISSAIISICASICI